MAILSFGTRLAEVLKAAEALAARGIAPTVADARFAKPLDRALILRLAREHEALICVEEGAVGGFGSHVAQLLAEEGVFDRGFRFRSMVLPDVFIDQASPERMYQVAGMDAAQIEAKALEVLGVAVVGNGREGSTGAVGEPAALAAEPPTLRRWHRVVLIDGGLLARLMIRHGWGCGTG